MLNARVLRSTHPTAHRQGGRERAQQLPGGRPVRDILKGMDPYYGPVCGTSDRGH